ncbi:MAG: PAS domain S-box protein [Phycisphaerae bacterium]|nr:PAS domain S-box protein [Phycisphaerae bacterium]
MSGESPATGEAFFRQLCEHAGIALIACDLDLRVTVWNLAASRMFGAAADRMIGAPIASVVPQEWREEAVRLLRRAIEEGTASSVAFQHRDEGGSPRELVGNIAPIVCDKGLRSGASVWVRDITQRITLQTELTEQRKMAALGQLAGALAHHFNNILGGVITSVDFALSSNDPVLKGRVLRQTAEALQRATGLVHELLAFAEGDVRVSDRAEVTNIILDVSNEVRNELAGSDMRFRLDLAPLPAHTVGRNQLTTVLRSLLKNAVEALRGEGEVTLSARLDGREIVIDVRDTGVGIDEETRLRVFEPFFSTKDRAAEIPGKGLGLGLAVSHGIVRLMGGTIRVTSTAGIGSCFSVRLPIDSKG